MNGITVPRKRLALFATAMLVASAALVATGVALPAQAEELPATLEFYDQSAHHAVTSGNLDTDFGSSATVDLSVGGWSNDRCNLDDGSCNLSTFVTTPGNESVALANATTKVSSGVYSFFSNAKVRPNVAGNVDASTGVTGLVPATWFVSSTVRGSLSTLLSPGTYSFGVAQIDPSRNLVQSATNHAIVAFGTFTVDSARNWSFRQIATSQLSVSAAPAGPFSADLSATVQSNGSTATSATGTVEFFENGASVDTAPVVNGVARVRKGNLSVGGHSFSATYTPDSASSFAASSSTTAAPVTVVGKTDTATSLTATATGTSTATATATVSAGGVAATTATGTITFTANGATVGSGTLTNGVATASISGLSPAASYSIAASYSGDDMFNSSVSGAQQIVTPAPAAIPPTATRLALTVTGTKSQGHSQVLTATVTPTAPGSVTFFDGSKKIAAAAIRGAKASVSVKLSAATHKLHASFAPSSSASFTGSTSPTVVAKIAKATSKLSFSVSPSKLIAKKTAASLRITVSATGLKPTGKLTVKIGKSTKIVSLTGGKATIHLPKFAKAGTQKISVHYLGSTAVGGAVKSVTVKVRAR